MGSFIKMRTIKDNIAMGQFVLEQVQFELPLEYPKSNAKWAIAKSNLKLRRIL